MSTTPIFSDDFNASTLSATPTNWSGGAWTVKEFGTGRALASYLGAGAGYRNYTAVPRSRVTFTHRTHYATTYKGVVFDIAATNTGTSHTTLEFSTAGDIRINNYNGTSNVQTSLIPYSANTDYIITIDADYTNRLFSVVINGTLFHNNGNLYRFQNASAGTNVGSFRLSSASNTAGIAAADPVYVDNVVVESITNEVATNYSVVLPTSANIGLESTNGYVSLPVGGTVTNPVTITLSDNGAGGTFNPPTVTLTTNVYSKTFTYKPASAGNKTISTTNDGGLTDAASATLAVSPSGVTISSPVAYRIFQRTGDVAGIGGTANIQISGQYTGNPSVIEARWNGNSSWYTIASGLTDVGGTLTNYTGILPSQPAGQGVLEVRSGSDDTTKKTIPFVGVGDIFVIAGQSNASGRATGYQSYFSVSGLRPTNFANDYVWKELVDPFDLGGVSQLDYVSMDGGASGSIWPIVASFLMIRCKCPVAFVPCPLGGTNIGQWQPGTNHQDRTTLYGSMVYRALQAGGGTLGAAGVKAVLWWQGESDLDVSTTQAYYNSKLDTIANNVATDLGCKFMPCKIQRCTQYLEAYQTVVNNAIGEAWSDNPNVITGPDLYDIVVVLHLSTNIEMQTAAVKWFNAITTGFFAPASTSSNPVSSFIRTINGNL